ncbi:phosphodiester glycosidase family protein [Actibacterium sp. D379-3]
MTRLKRLLSVLPLVLLPALAHATCAPLAHDGLPYTVCTIDPATEDLRLFRLDASGQVLGSFERLRDMLAGQGKDLTFAMNAGMYHQDRAPVGLYIENGTQQMRAIPSAGPGNFGMLPNGVLCITDGAAQVIETRAYLANPPACRFATQSGPMLVTGGALHPRFLPDSTSRYIRNGVGVTETGTVVFAISERPVTFHEFATLFRDALHTPEALFLDGNISRLYSPDLGRSDGGFPMGPIIGTVDAAAPLR